MSRWNPFIDGPVEPAEPSDISPRPCPAHSSELSGRDGTDVALTGQPRAVDAVADQARRQVSSIIAVFEDALDPSQPISVRLKAANEMLRVEVESTKFAASEANRDLESMSKVDMAREVVALIEDLQRAGLVRINRPNHDVIDGEVVSDED